MKLMSTIKGIDNELAISDVIPSYSQLRRAIHTLAFNEWQYQLHKCTDSNSESGGKLVLYVSNYSLSQCHLGMSLLYITLVLAGDE